MVASNDLSTDDFIAEYQSLAQDIERRHPACLRRFDLWTSTARRPRPHPREITERRTIR
jgi:hypothetical protein